MQGLEHLLQGCHQGAHSARLLHIRVQHHPDVDGIVLVRQQAHQGGILLGEEGGEQGDAEPLPGGGHQHLLGIALQDHVGFVERFAAQTQPVTGHQLFGKEQQVVLLQCLTRAGRAPPGQVVGRGVEPHLDGGEPFDHEISLLGAHAANGEIRLLIGDVAHADGGQQLEADAGVALAQQGERGQHEALGQGIRGGDAKLPFQLPQARGAHHGQGRLRHGLGLGQQRFPQGAGAIVSGGTDKQLGPQLLLEQGDPSPDGGLIHPELESGLPQAAPPCQGQEEAGIVPVDHACSSLKQNARLAPQY